MARKSQYLLNALAELIDISRSVEEAFDSGSEARPLARYLERHYALWADVLERNPSPPLPQFVEFIARVGDAKRLAHGDAEDFDQAVVDVLKTSLTMYRGLPGTGTIDPPMPPPREEKVREYATTDA